MAIKLEGGGGLDGLAIRGGTFSCGSPRLIWLSEKEKIPKVVPQKTHSLKVQPKYPTDNCQIAKKMIAIALSKSSSLVFGYLFSFSPVIKVREGR